MNILNHLVIAHVEPVDDGSFRVEAATVLGHAYRVAPDELAGLMMVVRRAYLVMWVGYALAAATYILLSRTSLNVWLTLLLLQIMLFIVTAYHVLIVQQSASSTKPVSRWQVFVDSFKRTASKMSRRSAWIWFLIVLALLMWDISSGFYNSQYTSIRFINILWMVFWVGVTVMAAFTAWYVSRSQGEKRD